MFRIQGLRPARRRLITGVACAASLLGLAQFSAPESSVSPRVRPAAAATSPLEASVNALLARMTEAERVGQLFMAGALSTGGNSGTVNVIRAYHVGSVILNGNSTMGVASTRTITNQLQAATSVVKLFVSTDQEGGEVQRLRGYAFSAIPSAVTQGRIAPATLRQDAGHWGRQLHAAGVNMDLGPVLDVVPAGTAANNPPIGCYDRQYGSTPAPVAAHGIAFAQGMADASVVATGKHFPGLGRVTANTDYTSHVTDTMTVRGDAFLQPFAEAIKAGLPVVMMSSAYYTRLDAHHPAALSPAIVTTILRGDLGFHGLVISDSIGATAFNGFSLEERAIQFIQSGGDIVLAGDPNLVPPMVRALLTKARLSRRFKAQVDAAGADPVHPDARVTARRPSSSRPDPVVAPRSVGRGSGSRRGAARCSRRSCNPSPWNDRRPSDRAPARR